MNVSGWPPTTHSPSQRIHLGLSQGGICYKGVDCTLSEQLSSIFVTILSLLQGLCWFWLQSAHFWYSLSNIISPSCPSLDRENWVLATHYRSFYDQHVGFEKDISNFHPHLLITPWHGFKLNPQAKQWVLPQTDKNPAFLNHWQGLAHSSERRVFTTFTLNVVPRWSHLQVTRCCSHTVLSIKVGRETGWLPRFMSLTTMSFPAAVASHTCMHQCGLVLTKSNRELSQPQDSEITRVSKITRVTWLSNCSVDWHIVISPLPSSVAEGSKAADSPVDPFILWKSPPPPPDTHLSSS